MPKHKFSEKQDVRVVADLANKDSKLVGCDATVLSLLPPVGKHPQYKVLIFGEKQVKGGIFEVDEREIAAQGFGAVR